MSNPSAHQAEWTTFWILVKDETLDEDIKPFLDFLMDKGWPAPVVRWILVSPDGREYSQTSNGLSGYHGGGTRFQQRLAAEKFKQDTVRFHNISLTAISYLSDSGDRAADRRLEQERLRFLRTEEYNQIIQLSVVCRLDMPTTKHKG